MTALYLSAAAVGFVFAHFSCLLHVAVFPRCTVPQACLSSSFVFLMSFFLIACLQLPLISLARKLRFPFFSRVAVSHFQLEDESPCACTWSASCVVALTNAAQRSSCTQLALSSHRDVFFFASLAFLLPSCSAFFHWSALGS